MEGVQENEPNTIELKVDSTMTRDEVVDKVIKEVEKFSCWLLRKLNKFVSSEFGTLDYLSFDLMIDIAMSNKIGNQKLWDVEQKWKATMFC